MGLTNELEAFGLEVLVDESGRICIETLNRFPGVFGRVVALPFNLKGDLAGPVLFVAYYFFNLEERGLFRAHGLVRLFWTDLFLLYWFRATHGCRPDYFYEIINLNGS